MRHARAQPLDCLWKPDLVSFFNSFDIISLLVPEVNMIVGVILSVPSIRARPMRAQEAHQGPAHEGPGAHEGLAHEGPGGSMRAQPVSAQEGP